MPLFQSLSFVINDQIRQNQIIINSGLSLRSNVSQQFQIINTNKTSNVNMIFKDEIKIILQLLGHNDDLSDVSCISNIRTFCIYLISYIRQG